MITLMRESMPDYMAMKRLEEHTKNKDSYAEKRWDSLSNLPENKEIMAALNMMHLHYTETYHHSSAYVFEDEGNNSVYYLSVARNRTNTECGVLLHVFSVRVEGAQEQVEKLEKFLEPYKHAEKEGHIEVTFTYYAHGHVMDYERQILCPTWEELKHNYRNQQDIESLMQLENPYEHGKLIFWYGDTGTGKTFLIRSLMREWKGRAQFFYIMDAENFFTHSDYMFENLVRDLPKSGRRRVAHSRANVREQEEYMFRVFIIEDALDLLLKENRKKMSPAMARLLNLTEGIIGQGFRVLVLITSNEDVTAVDPAFMRPGRCLQFLEFPSFDSNEAAEWLKRQELAADLHLVRGKGGNMTLAELYALKPGKKLKLAEPVRKVGFVK